MIVTSVLFDFSFLVHPFLFQFLFKREEWESEVRKSLAKWNEERRRKRRRRWNLTHDVRWLVVFKNKELSHRWKRGAKRSRMWIVSKELLRPLTLVSVAVKGTLLLSLFLFISCPSARPCVPFFLSFSFSSFTHSHCHFTTVCMCVYLPSISLPQSIFSDMNDHTHLTRPVRLLLPLHVHSFTQWSFHLMNVSALCVQQVLHRWGKREGGREEEKKREKEKGKKERDR